MYKQSINEIQQWLPAIDPCSIELSSNKKDTSSYNTPKLVCENIYTWAVSMLEKAKLSTNPKKIKPLLKKHDADSDEGCALRIVMEYEAMHASLENNDANTAAITGMKMLEILWLRVITKNKDTYVHRGSEEHQSQILDSMIQRSDESDDDIKLYQDTINDMQKKYPHCNINALRLLVATRLNVSKQQLDELKISPV